MAEIGKMEAMNSNEDSAELNRKDLDKEVSASFAGLVTARALKPPAPIPKYDSPAVLAGNW